MRCEQKWRPALDIVRDILRCACDRSCRRMERARSSFRPQADSRAAIRL
jgi:hypothetical protein